MNLTEATRREALSNTRRSSIASDQVDRLSLQVMDHIKGDELGAAKVGGGGAIEQLAAFAYRTEADVLVVVGGCAKSPSVVCFCIDGGIREGHQIYVGSFGSIAAIATHSSFDGVARTQVKPKRNSVAASLKKVVVAARKMGKNVTSIKTCPDGSITVSLEELSVMNGCPPNPFDVVLK